MKLRAACRSKIDIKVLFGRGLIFLHIGIIYGEYIHERVWFLLMFSFLSDSPLQKRGLVPCTGTKSAERY
jgi:hypothetical protein